MRGLAPHWIENLKTVRGDMENKETAQFLPYNAINEFMLNDYRLTVLQKVFGGMDHLPPSLKSALTGSIRRLFNIPGFRNPAQAPASLKIRGAVAPFEKNAAFTGQILAGWAELNSDLMQQVYHLLKDRNWEVLPLDADRTQIPGFLTHWPKGETYEALNQAFSEQHPESPATEDDVRLMVVWISGRLPYEMVEGED
jgi:hypothetical protein